MNILPEYITEEKWIKMSSVQASRDYAVDAACNANTFRISILIERGNNLWLEKRAREDRGRGGKLMYLFTYSH